MHRMVQMFFNILLVLSVPKILFTAHYILCRISDILNP